MRVAVTRPEGAAGAFTAALAAQGHEALSAPLLEIHPLEVALPGLTDFQALLATSAAAFAACGETALETAPP
ncbi:MAG: uroporphyrinogen-III synthase, partial [Rhodovibrionaceae bacterium]